ncbi:four-helix bundle copper-binding protein [Roseococcus sp. SDR]|uniref:four-helix bundle copper-binding protein n=1 Tax=Roseococcus sp. SDR TaxID=2835532 RepID=UPI001BCDB095|nr:four-helix bundle copper-binding protein [Roseococcus sp. SDR]MBS7789359.1 four-helix bundle copper-binding protein [Roseococcus sp. SDR]MBV1844673.1 four-helix bundle copper-binding protein [Roseococcus sp. SDR]
MHHDMQAEAKICLDCHATCVATIAHCLEHGGKHADAAHIRIMMDCAQICLTCADFMLRGSDHAHHLCKECAEICRACEASCRAVADGDAMDLTCAEACKACAESCSRMAA